MIYRISLKKKFCILVRVKMSHNGILKFDGIYI